MTTGVRVLDGALDFHLNDGQPTGWTEHVRSKHLSVGTYCLPAGGLDDQLPHREDEVYLVSAGRAVLEQDGGRLPVRPGSLIFVPAGAAHQFVDITEDLTLLVVFGPAYTGR